MHIHRAAVAVAVLSSLLPAGPASAAPPRLDVIFNVVGADEAGGNYVTYVSCRAAVIGSPTQVALATRVTCSVNDTTRTQMAPGGASTNVVATVEPLAPVTACVSGEAIVMETESGHNELFLVERDAFCLRIPGT